MTPRESLETHSQELVRQNSKSFPTGMLFSHCCTNPKSLGLLGPIIMVSSLSMLPRVMQTLSFVLPLRSCLILLLCLAWRQLLTPHVGGNKKQPWFAQLAWGSSAWICLLALTTSLWSACDQLWPPSQLATSWFSQRKKMPKGKFFATRSVY